MRRHIHFYDAATPENVPSGVYAAVYVNGYAWPEEQVRRMRRVIRVSVLREARWAGPARFIDVESGAAQPEDVVPFIKYGLELGHTNRGAYVNRSNWQQIRRLVDAAGLDRYCRWWVATLDGTMRVGDEWATQYYGGGQAAFDLSVLHGADDFLKP